MGDVKTVFINGEEYPFKPGQTVIQVAHENGIEVPHYCYHPGLSIAGNCRICMVEVEGDAKPQVSCKLQCAPPPWVSEPLRIQTESELAKSARAVVTDVAAAEVQRAQRAVRPKRRAKRPRAPVADAPPPYTQLLALAAQAYPRPCVPVLLLRAAHCPRTTARGGQI